VEQDPLTHLEHLSSTPVFSGLRIIRSLVLYVCFVDICLSFWTFSSRHCVVCSSSIYGYSDCPFGIFKLFLHRAKKSFSPIILKYCLKINVSLKIRSLRVLEQFYNFSRHVCWNWSCNLIFILNFNQISHMKICVSQIYEKSHSSKIVCTLFNQEKIAFCVLRKWYIKRCTTEQIFTVFLF
jgi:hypothetical protein